MSKVVHKRLKPLADMKTKCGRYADGISILKNDKVTCKRCLKKLSQEKETK